MKNRKTWIIVISSTFIFLLLLLFIQVQWLIDTAETEKRHFEQSVKLSLDYTMHQIMNDQQLCSNIQTCLLDSQCLRIKELRKLEWRKIDSIIRSNLEIYGIDCDYEFDVISLVTKPDGQIVNAGHMIFSESMQIAYQEGNLQIIIRLPDKGSFITRRIGPLFISSILLILLVAAAFGFTLKTYFKEEKRAILIKNFIHNMAHEFKTPVAVINFAISRIKGKLENPNKEKLLTYVDIIDNEKSKIQKHLTAILDLASFENKNPSLVFEKTDLRELIDEAIADIAPLLEEKNGELTIDFNCKNTDLECNREQMKNSILNILDNACKYSNGSLLIQINCYEKDESFILEITDNGIGISNKDLPYLFDKYFRVNTGNIHNIKGYGIGLSYVKEVITFHGGKIEASSRPGLGSTFRIRFPKRIVKSISSNETKW